MALQYRDKNGKLRSANMFDLLGSKKRIRAVLAETERRRDERNGSIAKTITNEGKQAKPVGGDEVKSNLPNSGTQQDEKTLEDVIKEREILAAKLTEMRILEGQLKKKANQKNSQQKKHDDKDAEQPSSRGSNTNDESNKGGKKNNDKKNPYRATLADLLSTEHSTDVDASQALATPTNGKDLTIEDTPRSSLSFKQCAMIMRLHDHYDHCKYVAMSSRFFDFTGTRIGPDEMKSIIHPKSDKSLQPKKVAFDYKELASRIFSITGIEIEVDDLKKLSQKQSKASGLKDVEL